jgi:hypothetical protein
MFFADPHRPADGVVVTRYPITAGTAVDRVQLELKGPFRVVIGKDDAFLFVTAQGRVVTARKADAGKPRAVETVWGDGKPPVAALIADGRTDRFYALALPPDGFDGAVAFPLELPLQPKPVPAERFAGLDRKDGRELLRRFALALGDVWGVTP